MVNDPKLEKKIDHMIKNADKKADEAEEKANEYFEEAIEKLVESKEKELEACKRLNERDDFIHAENELNQVEQIDDEKEKSHCHEKSETDRKEAQIYNHVKFERKKKHAKQFASNKAEEANKIANQCFEEAWEKKAEAKEMMSKAREKVDECNQYKSLEIRLDDAQQKIESDNDKDKFRDHGCKTFTEKIKGAFHDIKEKIVEMN